jgi:putative methionine-R-sulfoxide reductase with GAF domain
MASPRDYSRILTRARPIADRTTAMRHVITSLWSEFGEPSPETPSRGLISWVGFYEITPGAAEMTLTCREPKPACSPIGLQGMCGKGWRERTSFVVNDVAVLGSNYIACDPRDKSELVVPMLLGNTCWGVLDVDSYQVGAFSISDARHLGELCQRHGLTDRVAEVVAL